MCFYLKVTVHNCGKFIVYFYEVWHSYLFCDDAPGVLDGLDIKITHHSVREIFTEYTNPNPTLPKLGCHHSGKD